MILSTDDGVQPTPEDITDIQISHCLNCSKSYDPVRRVMFARLVNNQLLWWHVERCMKNQPKTI